MNISIDFYFQFLSFFFSVFFFIKKRDKIQLYFIPFLFATVCVEFLGWFLKNNKDFNKMTMYNIFTAVEFVFFGFLFYIHYKKIFFQRLVLFFMGFFIVCFIINISFFQGISKTFATYTYLLGSFIVVVLSCCFFYESVLPENIDDQLSKQPFFWICSGLLIYYLGSVIINALFEYLMNNDLRHQGTRIYDLINRGLIIILYSSYSIAFYLCPDNKKISSSPS